MTNSLKFWVELFFFLILPCGFLVGLLRIIMSKYMKDSRYCNFIINLASVIAALVCMEGLLWVYQHIGK